MRRIRVVLITLAAVAMVLLFASYALAMSPRGTIGEGRTDIAEGHNFIERGTILHDQREIKHGEEVIREGNLDIQQGEAMLRHQR